MTQEEIKEILDEQGLTVTLFESPTYDTAFLGVSHDGRAVYSFEKMVEYLVREYGNSEEAAADAINYDTIRSLDYMHGNKPIVLFDYSIYD